MVDYFVGVAIWHLTQGTTKEGAHQDLETIADLIRMSLLDAVVEGKFGRPRRSCAGWKARCRRCRATVYKS